MPSSTAHWHAAGEVGAAASAADQESDDEVFGDESEVLVDVVEDEDDEEDDDASDAVDPLDDVEALEDELLSLVDLASSRRRPLALAPWSFL